MNIPREKQIEIEKKSAEIACELAGAIEDILHGKLCNGDDDGLLQMIIYSELSSWYMAAHLAVCKANGMNNQDSLITDIINNGIRMFERYKIIKERH